MGRIMSRGLGKIQRAILAVLGTRDGYKWLDGGTPVTELTVRVYHPERFDHGECDSWDYTRSEYVATHRAVDALERRGLVTTWEYDRDMRLHRRTRGGRTRMRAVRLKR